MNIQLSDYAKMCRAFKETTTEVDQHCVNYQEQNNLLSRKYTIRELVEISEDVLNARNVRKSKEDRQLEIDQFHYDTPLYNVI